MTTEREIRGRADVGAAGYIIQRSDLTTRHLLNDQATLILVEEGRKKVRGSTGTCIANPGDAIAVQAGEVVDISNTPGRSGSYRALWICWSPRLLEDPKKKSAGVVLQSKLSEAFRASYHAAFDSLSDRALPPRIAEHRLREVLLWLAERNFHFARPGPASLGLRVRRLLSSDPSAEWSMDRVAHETATSIPTLRRKLAAEGVIFRDLVHDVRMGHALALLQNTDTPVMNVAMATGYASASRFTARFRARFGYLPTDIRHKRQS